MAVVAVDNDDDDAVRISLAPIGDLDGLARPWRDLEARSDGSFYLSWLWIGTWLAALPPGHDPWLLRVERGGRNVALAVLIRRRRAGLILGARASFHLHETGDGDFDTLTVEYNGLLVARDAGDGVAARVLEWLIAEVPEWDELHLPGVATEWAALARGLGLLVRLRSRGEAHLIDLSALSGEDDFLARLSANSRQQVRRAKRRYQAEGGLVLDVAATVDEAQAWFSALRDLHQQTWRGRGRPGAFAVPFFETFHRRLIAAGVAEGRVELLRARAGAEVIGYLYNFVHRGHVLYYQSGFAYRQDRRFRPGLVCHALAIAHYLGTGAVAYDFQAGVNQLKQTLASRRVAMVWAVLQRPSARHRAEALLRDMKRRLTVVAGIDDS